MIERRNRVKIKFIPQNIEVEVDSSKSLLQMATENKIEIRSLCKGVPSCAECRVKLVEGENNVTPPNKAEIGLLGTNYYLESRRLSCQVYCYGNVVVDVSEQLDRAENQKKKIRGFRSQRQVESKAVMDTMLLNEKSEPEATSNSQNQKVLENSNRNRNRR